MAETAYASTFIAGLFASQSAEQTPVKFSCASTPITTGDAVPLETARSTAPEVDISGTSSSSAGHVVVMLDLDVPGGPSDRSLGPFLHWMVPTSAGKTALLANEESSIATIPYIKPNPRFGTGRHQYVLLLLAAESDKSAIPAAVAALKPADVNALTPKDLMPLTKFDVQNFAKEAGYSFAAASWFTCERTEA